VPLALALMLALALILALMLMLGPVVATASSRAIACSLSSMLCPLEICHRRVRCVRRNRSARCRSLLRVLMAEFTTDLI
jgi:hypothetical protein